MQKVAVYSLVVLILIAAILLLFGHPVLSQPGPFGVPAGNIITWGALIALPLAQLLGLYNKGKRDSDPRIGIFYIGALGSLALSALWGVLSYGLAGNWNFNFHSGAESFVGSPEAAEFFFYLTAVTAILPFLILILFLIYKAL